MLDLEILPPYIEQKDLIHFFLKTRTKLRLFLVRCRVTYKDDKSEAKKLDDASGFMVSIGFKEKSQFLKVGFATCHKSLALFLSRDLETCLIQLLLQLSPP